MRKIIYRLNKMVRGNKFYRYWRNCFKNRSNAFLYEAIPCEERRGDFFYLNSYGKANCDRVIYNVNIYGGACGFFALYRRVIDALYLADRLNMTPFIKITHSNYNDDDDDNVFDYYFEQPGNLTKEDICQSYNVIEYNEAHMKWMEKKMLENNGLIGGYSVDEEFIQVASRISNKYIRLKERVRSKITNEIEELLEKKKTIAVHFRGNAFKVGFSGHPIALDAENYYQYIDDCLKRGYEQIFVATDDANALNSFVSKYGDKVIYFVDTLRSSNGIDIQDQIQERKRNGYKMGYEVLRDMFTLVACDALICGVSLVTITALIERRRRGGDYDYLRIIDKGLHAKNSSNNIDNYIHDRRVKKSLSKL